MYIRKGDFIFIKGLYVRLDEELKKKFLEGLIRRAGERARADFRKIQVVGEEIFGSRGIELRELVTKTMIKKDYKEAKEGN